MLPQLYLSCRSISVLKGHSTSNLPVCKFMENESRISEKFLSRISSSEEFFFTLLVSLSQTALFRQLKDSVCKQSVITNYTFRLICKANLGQILHYPTHTPLKLNFFPQVRGISHPLDFSDRPSIHGWRNVDMCELLAGKFVFEGKYELLKRNLTCLIHENK